MNRSTLATAVLVAGILAGCGASPVVTANTTATPDATTNPEGSLTPSSGAPGSARPLPSAAIQPGTYVGEDDGTRFTFTIPAAGWSNYPEAGCCVIFAGGDSDGAIIFLGGDITSLYARACKSSGTEFRFGPTVDDLAKALASLQDFEVSAPTDVTLSGFKGERVKVTVPNGVDVSDPACDQGGYSSMPGRHYQVAGQTDDSWILDVGGRRLVPTFATTTQTPAALLAQVDQIRDSLVIERP